MGGAASERRDERFPVPPYLPAPARTILPWARRYVAITARRSALPMADAWDEAITALLRASVYFQPGAGSFVAYARTAVIRGLWRYCRCHCHRTPCRCRRTPRILPDPARALTAPSAETVAALADAAADYVALELSAAAALASRASTPRRPFARAAAAFAGDDTRPRAAASQHGQTSRTR
jgi:hypothetical protein